MPNQQITLFFSKLELALNQLPTIVGNEVVNYSLEAFDKQSWDGLSWQQRKSKKDTERALLIKSGRLRRSIRIISTSPSSVIVGSDVIYAAIHNNGGIISRAPRSETFSRNRYVKGNKKGAFKKGVNARTITSGPIRGLTFKQYSINMPMRRFLGINQELKDRIKARVLSELKQSIAK